MPDLGSLLVQHGHPFEAFSTGKHPRCDTKAGTLITESRMLQGIDHGFDRIARQITASAFTTQESGKLRDGQVTKPDGWTATKQGFRQATVIIARQDPANMRHIKPDLVVWTRPFSGGHWFQEGQQRVNQTECVAFVRRDISGLFHLVDDDQGVADEGLHDGFKNTSWMGFAPALLAAHKPEGRAFTRGFNDGRGQRQKGTQASCKVAFADAWRSIKQHWRQAQSWPTLSD